MSLTLLLTGMRPGELTHLLLPDDLEMETGWLYIRNKSQMGWQVKTRNERDVPLVPVLGDVLRVAVGGRAAGPLFCQRLFSHCVRPPPTTARRGPSDRVSLGPSGVIWAGSETMRSVTSSSISPAALA